MTLNEIRNIAIFLVNNKFPNQDPISVERFSELLVFTNLDFFKEMAAKKEYKSLRPFMKVLGEDDIPPLEVNNNGIATLPIDFYENISLVFRYQNIDGEVEERQIEVLDSYKYHQVNQSSIEFPTKRYPKANMQETYIRFRPKNLRYVVMNYLRWPKTPYFAYKNTNGYTAYDPANSQELEWYEDDKIEITMRILKLLGVHTKRIDIIELSEREEIKNKEVL